MTPEKAFRSGGRNPHNGLCVRDWYALGCNFAPMRVMHEGTVLFGFRILICTDMASRYMMHTHFLLGVPDAVRVADLIQCFADVNSKYGPPRVGVVISHSVWYSSAEMIFDEDTAPQGEFLRNNEIEFGPMSHIDKIGIQSWASGLGIHCEFNADNVADYPTR
jgi:hypothetical protein